MDVKPLDVLIKPFRTGECSDEFNKSKERNKMKQKREIKKERKTENEWKRTRKT